MKKAFLIGLALLSTTMSFARSHQMIDTLGVSPKGQYVALEEYGYRVETHSYYVNIKVMNVWKKEYVGNSVILEVPAHRPNFLAEARQKAKFEAKSELRKFNIEL